MQLVLLGAAFVSIVALQEGRGERGRAPEDAPDPRLLGPLVYLALTELGKLYDRHRGSRGRADGDRGL
jgi:hypothetical protein